MNSSRVVRWLLLAGSFALGYLAVHAVVGSESVRAGLDHTMVDGEELGIVLVVSADCGGCRDPALPSAWGAAVERARAEAEARHAHLTLTGICLSRTPAAGWDFLSAFGEFHEVMVGRQWQNSGAEKFIFGRMAGPGVVPQIIIFERDVSGSGNGRPVITNERVVQRRMGLEGILNWLEYSGQVSGGIGPGSQSSVRKRH